MIYHVQTIYIKDREPLQDKYIFFSGNFIVVADDMDTSAPSWINSNLVEEMEKVEPVKGQSSNKMRVSFLP